MNNCVRYYVLKCFSTFSAASPTSKEKMLMNESMKYGNNIDCSQDGNHKGTFGFHRTEVTGYLWRNFEGGSQIEYLQM